jgi:two-component system chemotaxis response regulator CheB
MTGNLDDGTAGLATIKQLGGVAIVQDPADALFPSMPANAARYVAVDHTPRLVQIAPLLVTLTAVTGKEERIPVPESINVEVRIAKDDNPHEAGLEALGTPSPSPVRSATECCSRSTATGWYGIAAISGTRIPLIACSPISTRAS